MHFRFWFVTSFCVSIFYWTRSFHMMRSSVGLARTNRSSILKSASCGIKVFRRGGQMLLRLGDTDVPYSEEFCFFITTKLANPHYMPEICIKVGS